MDMICGLGNPGAKYAKTRHNVGFWLVEEIARRYGAQFSSESKFQARTSPVMINNQKCWLLMPETYMNCSGSAVSKFASYYQISAPNIIVAHDDLDLLPGQIKIKQDGGEAGHNGLRDISKALGSREYFRIRIGIGHPGARDKVSDYVLHPPALSELIEIKNAIDRIITCLPDMLAGDWEKVMNELH